MLMHWSQFVPNNYVNPTSEDIKLYIIINIRLGLIRSPVRVIPHLASFRVPVDPALGK